MIENVTNTAAATAAQGNGMVQRHTPFGDVMVPADWMTDISSGPAPNFAALFGAASNTTTPAAPTPTKPSAGPALSASQHAAKATVPLATTAALRTSNAALSGLARNLAARLGSSPNSVAVASLSSKTSSPATPVSAPGSVKVQTATPAATAPAATSAPAAPAVKPGIQALVAAIMDGSFKGTNVTDPAQLTQVTPWMTNTMPNFYFASDQTANQLAQLLGGKVVQMTPFGQSPGWSVPLANFIQLPNGQTFNAADVAYYSRCSNQGAAQLTADLTQTINEGSAFTKFYHSGGDFPIFDVGYTGPAIAGMDYAAGTVAADGTVINPVMQPQKTQGT